MDIWKSTSILTSNNNGGNKCDNKNEKFMLQEWNTVKQLFENNINTFLISKKCYPIKFWRHSLWKSERANWNHPNHRYYIIWYTLLI